MGGGRGSKEDGEYLGESFVRGRNNTKRGAEKGIGWVRRFCLLGGQPSGERGLGGKRGPFYLIVL